MILSDRQIKQQLEQGAIKIDPFEPECLGTNSYDVHLGKNLLVYADNGTDLLDARKEPKTVRCEIGPNGRELVPGTLYLGVTEEYTETHRHVPFLDGKSSVGRLGIFVHVTAGRGDIGFFGHWTLELLVVRPVRVYAGMPIGQLIYFEAGVPDVPYDQKASAKYNQRGRQENPMPMPSQMWRNF